MSPRNAHAKRTILPRVKAANVICPKHGSRFLAGPNAKGEIICLSCGWTAPYDHKVALTPRATPNVER